MKKILVALAAVAALLLAGLPALEAAVKHRVTRHSHRTHRATRSHRKSVHRRSHSTSRHRHSHATRSVKPTTGRSGAVGLAGPASKV